MRQVLWLGVTPLEQGTSRVYQLASLFKDIRVNFPNTTEGMAPYEEWANYLDEFDIIATDQEHIDESWENFFEDKKNNGKQIIQYKDDEWSEVKSGFSKNYSRSR